MVLNNYYIHFPTFAYGRQCFKLLKELGLNDKSPYLTQSAHRHKVQNTIKNKNRFQTSEPGEKENPHHSEQKKGLLCGY